MRRSLPLSLLILVGVASTACADILVWRDAAGTRHFTNQLDQVPAEFRDQAEVLVHDYGYDAAPPSKVVAAKQAKPKPKPKRVARRAQVVTDRVTPSEEYVRGVERGIELARRRELVDQAMETAASPVVITAPPLQSSADDPYGCYRNGRIRWQDRFREECSGRARYSGVPVGIPFPTGYIVVHHDHDPPRSERDRPRGRRMVLR